MFFPLRGIIPTTMWKVMNRRIDRLDGDGHLPWLAMAFSPGHGERLSPSPGGEYFGHCPWYPGSPSEMTCPAGRSGVMRLKRTRRKSHR